MHNYGYDKIYQLTSVDYPDGSPYTDTAFDFDPLGNRETVTEGTNQETYTSNNLNQYTNVNSGQPQGLSLQYDKNGNLLTDGTNTYEYDCENRLIKATTPANIIRYKYDAHGRRITKEIYGLNDVFIKGETFLYDGDAVLAEYDSISGSQLRKFVNGPGIDEYVMMENIVSGERFFYSMDGLGSVSEMTDVTGVVIEKYSYSSFGQTIIKDANDNVLIESEIGNPYAFTGIRIDSETSLYYFRTRYYTSTLGRFLQTDSAGYYGGLNLYNYCFNAPLNFIDPFGLWGKEVHYEKTKQWVKETGFSDENAETIARYCEGIDTWTGETGAMPWGDQSRHFDIPLGDPDSRDMHATRHQNKALQNEILGDHAKVMEELGKGLHSVQDKIAHKNWDTSSQKWLPHGWSSHPKLPGEDYDDWNLPKHKQEREATERMTKEYLKKYRERLGWHKKKQYREMSGSRG